MSKKSTKATKTAKATAGLQIKRDAKGRFWVVAKDGKEHGPFENKKEATDAKAALASGTTPTAAETKPAKAKPAKAKKVNEPQAKRVSAIDAAAQVLVAQELTDVPSDSSNSKGAEAALAHFREILRCLVALRRRFGQTQQNIHKPQLSPPAALDGIQTTLELIAEDLAKLGKPLNLARRLQMADQVL